MQTPRSNRFAGMCQCGTQVPAGKGALTRRSGKYAVLCENCTPVPTEAMERARNHAQAGEAAERRYAQWMAMGDTEAMRVSFTRARNAKMRTTKAEARKWARENLTCDCNGVHYVGDHDKTHTQDCASNWSVRVPNDSTVEVRDVGNITVRSYVVQVSTGQARKFWQEEAQRRWEAVQTHA